MRSFLLIAVTVLLLAVGFGAYVWWQADSMPAPTANTLVAPPATRPATNASGNPLQAGQGAWVKKIGPRGELLSQFRARRFEPQESGVVLVEEPVAEFFLNDGQILRLEGRSGAVNFDNGVPAEGDNLRADTNAQMQMPNRGELRGVKITLLESPEAAEPVMSVFMNNAAFDNDTFRIYTESYTDDAGRLVPQDQVPVQVRGRDFEFDGRGLTIRYNDVDQRLELLEIIHGEQLVVRDLARMAGGRKDRIPTTQQTTPITPAASPADAPETTAVAAAPKRSVPIYRATFGQDVRVMQDGIEAIRADELTVDFLLSSDKSSKQRPTTRPATAPAELADATPATRPSTQPATRDVPQEMIVRWTGSLKVVPRTADDPAPAPRPGEALVRLAGAPLLVAQDGTEIRAARALYGTRDGDVLLERSADHPVRLKTADGGELVADRVRFAPAQRLVSLEGAGHATIPVPEQGNEAPRTIAAKWQDRATLHLRNASLENLSVREALLEGKVHIEDRQVRIDADALDLTFAEADAANPAARTALTGVVARGHVDASVQEDADKTYTIRADRLELQTARSDDGTLYPAQLLATGSVAATGEDAAINAGHLVIAMAPAAAAADKVELQKLTASQDVAARFANNGGQATADQLSIVMRNNEPRIELIGRPARVAEGDNVLVGPIVRLSPGQSTSEIVGAGSLKTRYKETPEDEPTPVEVTWGDRAILNPNANTVEVLGNVNVSLAGDGAEAATAKGQRLTLGLADVATPTTQPEQRAAADDQAAAAAAPLSLDAIRGGVLGGKEVVDITLAGDVALESVAWNPAGKIERQMNLLADSLRHDLRTGRLTIPGAGRMLYVSNEEPVTPADSNAPRVAGAMAAEWKKDLVYEQSTGRMTMDGDVTVVHEPHGRKDNPYRLQARRVIADIAQKSGTGTDTATAGKGPIEGLDVTRLLAQGPLRLDAPGQKRNVHFEAHELEYHPQSNQITARGADATPAQLFNEDGSAHGTFGALTWDLDTDEIKLKDFQIRTRR